MSFDEEKIQQVWEKGRVVGNNPDKWRKDGCNAWISRAQHGNRDSKYGWEIHHVDPKGGDNISNRIPLL